MKKNSESNLYDSWTIKVFGKIESNLHIGRLIVEDECFVSANTKLCDFANSVCLSTEFLARRYLDALAPVLRRRYGDAVRLSIFDRGTQGRPEFDDTLVTARIEQSVFAPNRRPNMLSK